MLNWPLIVEQLQLQPAENNKSPALGIKALSELKSPCSWGCCVRNVFFCGGGWPNFCMKFTPEILGATVSNYILLACIYSCWRYLYIFRSLNHSIVIRWFGVLGVPLISEVTIIPTPTTETSDVGGTVRLQAFVVENIMQPQLLHHFLFRSIEQLSS